MSEPRDPTPFFLLSGLGADQRVFTPQLERFTNLIIPKWLTPLKDESLPSYGQRFAAQIDPGGPCFIGGASFGGFVATEMARHLAAKACFLIGSVKSPSELPRRITMFRPIRRLTSVLPIQWAPPIARFALHAIGEYLSVSPRAVAEQVGQADPAFVRWAARAVLEWNASPDVADVPVHHIHGARDWVLPAACTRPDLTVPGGGHLITLTHPNLVNDFLHTHITNAS